MTFVGKLRPFQKSAAIRMVKRKNLLVALDLGLGKSVVTIWAAERLIDTGRAECGFIIAPRSLKRQWKARIDQFTGGEAGVTLVEGPPRKRSYAYAEYASGDTEYLLLNPEQIVNDWEIVSALPRDFIAADEVQWAKSFNASRSQALKQLDAPYRWGLTGQPIDNQPEDLFSIMEWIDPEVLGDFDVFNLSFIDRNLYGDIVGIRNAHLFHEVMKPALVRRTKEEPEIKAQMPDLMEESIIVDFDVEGARLYTHIAQELTKAMDEALKLFGPGFDPMAHYHGEDPEFTKAQGRIQSIYLCMRMLCDHPQLLRISAKKFQEREQTGKIAGSEYAAELAEDGLLDRLKKTPKLDAFIDLLHEIFDANPKNKVVVFSKWKEMLRILGAATESISESVFFMGGMSDRAREASTDTFSKDPDCRLFLSSDAGGAGLDLPMANYLVSYDLPWTPGVWNQRNGRINRLSSEFPAITLLSILMAESIEERMYDVVQDKERIGTAVIDGKGWDARGYLRMNAGSLKSFVKDRVV